MSGRHPVIRERLPRTLVSLELLAESVAGVWMRQQMLSRSGDGTTESYGVSRTHSLSPDGASREKRGTTRYVCHNRGPLVVRPARHHGSCGTWCRMPRCWPSSVNAAVARDVTWLQTGYLNSGMRFSNAIAFSDPGREESTVVDQIIPNSEGKKTGPRQLDQPPGLVSGRIRTKRKKNDCWAGRVLKSLFTSQTCGLGLWTSLRQREMR